MRKNAAISLIENQPAKAIPVLISLLEYDNYLMREEVAEILGTVNSQAVIPKLISLLKDEYVDVRCNAAESLGNLEAEAAAVLLLLTGAPGISIHPKLPYKPITAHHRGRHISR